MPALRLSIIIPCLDEEGALERPLQIALAQGDEVIVTDGGSVDGSIELARRLGAGVVVGGAGRGEQLQRGAAAASGDILLFLHADTELPPNAAQDIRRAIVEGAVGGAFLLTFDSPHWLQRLGAWLINRRTRWTRIPLGDQAQFATAAAYREIGGYRDWPILEDLDFARRLGKHGRIAILPGPVTTAARRYRQGGTVRTVLRNWLIWILFACGVPPKRLEKLYRKIR
ncbi:MAG: TIGR04283 family arsenosugar biosynthesis glycosyltransferase [Acidobacteriota bacterium]